MCAGKLSTKLQHSCIFFNSPEAETTVNDTEPNP